VLESELLVPPLGGLPAGGLPPLESVLVLDAVVGSTVAGANVELIAVQAARSRVRVSSKVRMSILIYKFILMFRWVRHFGSQGTRSRGYAAVWLAISYQYQVPNIFGSCIEIE
jgi:hypothetical protein